MANAAQPDKYQYVTVPLYAWFQHVVDEPMWSVMDEEVIAHMRERVHQLRRVMSLAHDPRMIEMVQKIIDSGEADIKRLEAEQQRGKEQ